MIIVFLGSVSGDQLMAITVFYLLLTLFSLYLVVKHEHKLSLLLWSLIILVFPIVGSFIYLSKRTILKNRAH